MSETPEMLDIYTDEFLGEDLHYALGAGIWNEGGGHVWTFDAKNAAWAREQIIANFVKALDKLFEENCVEWKA